MTSKEICRNELRTAIRQLSDRCLYSASKWAAEQLVGIEQDPAKFTPSNTRFQRGSSSIRRRFHSNEGSSTPIAGMSYVSTPVMEEDEVVDGDVYLLAKSYFDCREYKRAAHVLREQNGKKSVFLRLYALYLAGEKRKEEEVVELEGSLGKSDAVNQELVSLERELSTHRKNGIIDPFGLYLYGLVLKQKGSENLARTALVESVNSYPWNWSAWSELQSLCTTIDILNSLNLNNHWMKDFFLASAYQELRMHNESLVKYENLQGTFSFSNYIQAQIAKAQYSLREFDQVEAIFEELLRNDPYRVEDMDMYSNVLYAKECFSTLLRRHNLREHWSCTDNTNLLKEICYVGAAEPTSVLDTRRSPSPPTSTSTLSSSLGGGGGGGTASTDTTVAAPPSSLPENPSPLDKCGGGGGLGIDDWESVLPESPGQGPSILGLIMSDVEDPSLGLNKLLQSGGGGGGGGGSHLDLEFSVDHGLVFEANTLAGESIVDPSLQGPSCSDFHNARLAAAVSNSNAMFSGVFQNQNQMVEGVDEKPQIFNSSQVVMNQNQTQFTQNPALFMPLPYASPVQDHHQNHHHHHLLGGAPPAKRFNSGSIGPNYPVKSPFLDSGQENFNRRQQQQQPQQVQLFPHHSHHHNLPQQQQRPSMAALAKQKMVNEDIANQQLQQGISDQLFKAVELIETGNSVLAQGILARLNHQLSSPIGKPFQRAAFYFREALQLLLQNPSNPSTNPNPSPFSIIFKIAAYKSFSEVSPVLQFANFTSNQALLEAFNGCDRVHIIDFDIGYGGQWASLMQELALRSNTTGGGPPFLRITAFASTSTHDDFELGFTQENLKNFANDLNIGFELEVVNVECLNSGSWPLPLNVSEDEAIAVNLPVGSFFNYSLSLPMILRFIKHLNPKIVVSVDRGCSRMDAPFPHRVINALHSYSALLESMEAVTMNMDTQLKIERYLVQPCIEKVVTNPQCSNERVPPWKSVFLSSGFCPLTFSNFTESQAECLLQRTPVQGFHIDKRHSSLVLCWHRKELVSISAWRS